MYSPPSLEKLLGWKCGPHFESIAPQLETSNDVRQLTYTFYTGEDGSAPHGPYCQDCMNQMFRIGKLDAISMVFVFTTLGFIPFPTRALVFMNGMNVPFSMKDITEEFLVMSCSNCSQNNTNNTASDGLEQRIIRTFPKRKRKHSNTPSRETLPSITVKEEFVTSPNSKKMTENVADQSSNPVTVSADEKVGLTINFGTEQSTVADQPTLSTELPPGGVLGDLMSQFGWLPVATSTNDNNEGVQNVNQTSTSSSIALKKIVNSITAIAQNEAPVNDTVPESSAFVDKPTISTGQSAGEGLNDLMSQFGCLPAVEFAEDNNNNDGIQIVNKEPSSVCATNTNVNDDSSFCEIIEIFPVNSRVANTGKPRTSQNKTHIRREPMPFKSAAVNDMKKLTTVDENRRKERTNMTKQKQGVDSSKNGLCTNTFQCLYDVLLSMPPPPPPPYLPVSANSLSVCSASSFQYRADQECAPSSTISERLQESPVDRQESGIPFVAGRMNDFRGMSVEEIYNGISFLNDCGLKRYGVDFGKFMCYLFPEITNIHKCELCEIPLPYDASGWIYISHFISKNHIVQAMNRGLGFSRDFISLKKCFLLFLTKNKHHCYAKRLRGTELAECIHPKRLPSKGRRNRHRANNMLRENSLASLEIESPESTMSKVHHNACSTILQVADGMNKLNNCGMKRYLEGFRKFLCYLFPDKTNIHRCDYCNLVIRRLPLLTSLCLD